MTQLTINQPIFFIETPKFENMLNYTSENGQSSTITTSRMLDRECSCLRLKLLTLIMHIIDWRVREHGEEICEVPLPDEFVYVVEGIQEKLRFEFIKEEYRLSKSNF